MKQSGVAADRARAVVVGLRAVVAVVVAFVVVAFLEGVLADPRIWGSADATLLVIAILLAFPWDRILERRLGDVLLGLLFLILLADLAVIGTIATGLNSTVLAMGFALVAFSAVMMSPATHLIIMVATATLIGLTSMLAGRAPSTIITPIVAILAVGATVEVLARSLDRESRRAKETRLALEAKENDLRRLYEIAETTASAGSVEAALPMLVGRIGRYLHAEVGALLLRKKDEAALEVVSPIWTAGNPLEVGPYREPLNRAGDIQRVYLTGQPAIIAHIDENPDAHGLLGELGVRNAIAVPLEVEDRTFGVMVLGDKEGSPFAEPDLERLHTLSSSVALAIAQLERIEEASETSRRMAELARMKTDFVSVVSHELRTPLTSIIGSLATLSRPEFAPAQEDARRLLATARNQADRLRRLIEDLLIVSRIEARSMPTHPQRIILTQLLAASIAEIPNADTVTMTCPDDVVLRSDPDHIRRIVINLVENALKHAGGTQVDVRGSQTPSTVTIAVTDHGPGIPEELHDQIFERFTQVGPSNTRTEEGAGLGLAIVRGLIQGIGATIQLSETPGGGATFTVEIPKEPSAGES